MHKSALYELKSMNKFECAPTKPWGIHPQVRNDEDCPRCGWTAPGPLGDARARAAEHGWTVIEGSVDAVSEAPQARAA